MSVINGRRAKLRAGRGYERTRARPKDALSKLKYEQRCSVCQKAMPKGSQAAWNAEINRWRHVSPAVCDKSNS